MIQFDLKKEKVTESDDWFGTKEGIEKVIETLEGLNQLISTRHYWGYVKQKRMPEFIIFGSWYLDTCGNCSTIEGFIPREKIANFPNVATREELNELLKTYDRMTKPNVITSEELNSLNFDFSDPKNKGRPYATSISSSSRMSIPPAHIYCTVCKRKWTIENCFDSEFQTDSIHLNLKDFVGKTLKDVQEFYNKKEDASYFVPTDEIQNPKHIDLSPHHKYQDLKVNEHGWVQIEKDYIIQENDEVSINIRRYYHNKCLKIEKSVRQQKQFQELFDKSGFEKVFFYPIKNEYCSCINCGPWFNVLTSYGEFKIGWRKSVINIEFQDMNLDLFKEENVTKGKNYIHAWGYEKAQEYLTKIREDIISKK